MEKEWEKVNIQTSWVLEPCYMPERIKSVPTATTAHDTTASQEPSTQHDTTQPQESNSLAVVTNATAPASSVQTVVF